MTTIRPATPRIVIATPHPRYDGLERILREVHGFEVTRLRDRDELDPERVAALAPDFVFFPHWSWIIPKAVHERFECVIFHMTDVPYGRGGSPLQNLIVRGHQETRLTALKCSGELDAGPVYLKKPLSLMGSAEEIFVRAAHLMEGMVVEIALDRPTPQPQSGPVTVFARRGPQDGDLQGLDSLPRVHDHIRMLDAEGYPRAFLLAGRLRLEFERSRLSHDHITADVRITLVPASEGNAS